MNPNRMLLAAASALLAIFAAVFLTSCESIPISAAYTGHAGGHSYTAAYGSKTGIAVVVSKK